MRILVLGGTAFVGRHLVARALEAGHDLTLFNRGRTAPDLFPQVRTVVGDREQDLALLTGRSWDAVVDTSGYLPRVVGASARSLAGSVDRYLFISTASVYPPDVPPGTTEDDAVLEAAPPDVEEITDATYGPLKRACELEVEAAFGSGSMVVRPGYIVGPHDPTDRFTWWVRRGARGGALPVPAPPDAPLQFLDARDLASFLLVLLEGGASGVVNTVGPGERCTVGSFLATVARVAGSDLEPIWIEEAAIRRACPVPLEDAYPMWEAEPGGHTFAAGRARALGLVCRPVAETVAETLAWDRTRPSTRPMRAGLSPQDEAGLHAALGSPG